MKKNIIIKKTFIFLLCLALAFSMCGCDTYNAFKKAFIDPPAEENETIKIGILEPLTGSDAADAKDEISGIELAHDLFPYMNGMPVELVYADNQSDVSVAPVAAQSLIDAGCSVILGSYKSVLTLASSDIIAAKKIPSVAITNTNPLVTSTNSWYFRVCCIDSYEGKGAADYVKNFLKTENIVVVKVEGYDYATAMSDEFKTALGDSNITVINIDASGEDYSAYFHRLEYLNPDIIYFPSSMSQATKFIQASRDAGYNFTFLGTSNWNGISVDDVYFTLDFDPNETLSEISGIFNNACEKKFGENTSPSDSLALGFDAYLLVREAVTNAGGVDSKFVLRNALSSVDGMLGATGTITMNGTGDPIKEILIEHLSGGSLTAEYTSVPEREDRQVDETEENEETQSAIETEE